MKLPYNNTTESTGMKLLQKREDNTMDAYALIVAGGIGTRFGSAVPKQYIPLEQHEVIAYSLHAFSECGSVKGICIVARAEWKEHILDLVKQERIGKVMGICSGGETRRDSVYSGLVFLKENGAGEDDVILVHDAARPLLTQEVILENIRLASEFGACDTAVPVSDTPLISEDGVTICSVPPRRTVYMSQTPQSFRLGILMGAHEKVPRDAADITDDVSLVLRTGHPVYLVKGTARLLKITGQEDLFTAQRYLEEE